MTLKSSKSKLAAQTIAVLALLLWMSGCGMPGYDPEYIGKPCILGDKCPADMVCDLTNHKCYPKCEQYRNEKGLLRKRCAEGYNCVSNYDACYPMPQS